MQYSAAESSVEVARPLVLGATDHLPAALLAVLEEACLHLGAQLVPWKSGREPGAERRPAAVVASLPEGARRIPEDLGRMLGRAMPRLPLLLLCSEPLARPTMTTQQNRVVLVGPPISARRVASRLRMILAPADAMSAPEARWLTSGSSAIERLFPHCWVAALRAGETASEPALYPDATRSLTVLLSLRRGAPPDALVERVTATLKADAPDSEKEAGLFTLLGVDRAAVHLDTASGDWLVYFPWRERALSLLSPRRVPHVWDFRKTLERSRLLRVRAAGGDLLLATTALRSAVEHEREQRAVLDSGGPALLERLAGPRFEAARPFAGLLVELV
jgi:hypothetical protein